jgi:hypothetical protein
MAVWIYAYGKNELETEDNVQSKYYLDILNSIDLDELKILNSIAESKYESNFVLDSDYNAGFKIFLNSMTKDEYKVYLDTMKLQFVDIGKIILYFKTEREKREKEEELYFNMANDNFKNKLVKSKLELIDNKSFVNKLSYFDTYYGIRLNLINDLIRIEGPFSVFSNYSTFLKSISKTSREYYHSYFSEISKAFKSDFILYAHEWSGLDDDVNKEFDFAKLKEQANWVFTSSDSLETMDRFYYEQFK